MESKNITIAHLEDLYASFVESIREAFISIITDSNTSKVLSVTSQFHKHAQVRQARFFVLIDAIISLSKESSSYEEIERFSKLIKMYISQDINAMQKKMKRFALRVRALASTNNAGLENAIVSERERMFSDDRNYGLRELGQLSSRVKGA